MEVWVLQASEFFVGNMADAEPLSLLLPRGGHEQPFLIVRQEDKPMAVFIGTEHRFHVVACEGNTTWKGIIVPNVEIDLDESSVFDPSQRDSQPGCLIRTDNRLVLSALQLGGFPFRDYQRLVVCDRLRQCGENVEAAFGSWSVTIGTGREKRTLFKVLA